MAREKYYFPNATLPPKKIYIHIASLRRLSLRQLMSYTFTPFIRLPFLGLPLPESNSEFTPETRPGPKKKCIFQPSIFKGYVSLRKGTFQKGKASVTLSYFRKFHLPSISYHQVVGVNSLLVSGVCFNDLFE